MNKYRNLKLAGAIMESGAGRVKSTRAGEPIGVVIHICMKTSQRNYLYSYIYLKLAKMSCFFFLSFIFFSSTKSEDMRAEQVLPRGVRVGTSERGRCLGKRVRG
jgi:hypothetical protein